MNQKETKKTITEQRNEAASELAAWLLENGYQEAGETKGQPTVVSRIPGNRFIGANWKGQRKRFKPTNCMVWVTIGIRTTCLYKKPERHEGIVMNNPEILGNYDTLMDLEIIKKRILIHQETD